MVKKKSTNLKNISKKRNLNKGGSSGSVNNNVSAPPVAVAPPPPASNVPPMATGGGILTGGAIASFKPKTWYGRAFKVFLENMYSLNNSKFFAGFVMLTMNIGSKYITIELSDSQEAYVRYTLGRQILIFAILWMGTRDIVIALILTCVFIIFADYLFNENSKYCLLPKKMKELEQALDTNNDGKISTKEIQNAINILKKAHKNKSKTKKSVNKNSDLITKGLVKENFM